MSISTGPLTSILCALTHCRRRCRASCHSPWALKEFWTACVASGPIGPNPTWLSQQSPVLHGQVNRCECTRLAYITANLCDRGVLVCVLQAHTTIGALFRLLCTLLSMCSTLWTSRCCGTQHRRTEQYRPCSACAVSKRAKVLYPPPDRSATNRLDHDI